MGSNPTPGTAGLQPIDTRASAGWDNVAPMLFFRIAGVIGGVVLLALGAYGVIWIRVEGDDPNLLVVIVPSAVAVLGLALVVRALRAGRP